MYPKDKIIYDNADAKKGIGDLEPKRIGFHPVMISDFFEGMEVLAVRGRESGEEIFGLYSEGEYCGHVYFGHRWNMEQVAKICKDLMPPRMSLMKEWGKKNYEIVEYYGKLELCHYAWVYQKVLVNVKK